MREGLGVLILINFNIAFDPAEPEQYPTICVYPHMDYYAEFVCWAVYFGWSPPPNTLPCQQRPAERAF